MRAKHIRWLVSPASKRPQYADNYGVIPSLQFLSEFLAEIVIQDIKIDLFEILTGQVILIISFH